MSVVERDREETGLLLPLLSLLLWILRRRFLRRSLLELLLWLLLLVLKRLLSLSRDPDSQLEPVRCVGSAAGAELEAAAVLELLSFLLGGVA